MCEHVHTLSVHDRMLTGDVIKEVLQPCRVIGGVQKSIFHTCSAHQSEPKN